MYLINKTILKLFVCLLCFISFTAHASMHLTLEKLEMHVLKNDLKLKQLNKQTQATSHAEIYQAEKPDMRFTITALNLAVAEPLNFSKEPLTQVLIGASQQFLRGDSLNIKKNIAQFSTKIAATNVAINKQQLLKKARNLWLNVYIAKAQIGFVKQQLAVFKDILPIALGRYKVGRGSQQDVIKIRLKISQLNENVSELEGVVNANQARLTQWIDVAQKITWPQDMAKQLTVIPNIDVAALNKHPELKLLLEKYEQTKIQINLINEAYQPSMKLNVSYGIRDSRGDVFSVGLQSDLPWLDSSNSLDKKVLEQEQKSEALWFSYKNKQNEMKAKMKQDFVLANNYKQRWNQYKFKILPELLQISSVILGEYQAGESSLSDLLIARDAEIRNSNKMLKLQNGQAKKIINLLYFLGTK